MSETSGASLSRADVERIGAMLRVIGGTQVTWGAQSTLDVWLVEQRIKSEALASRRLLVATWVLAVATLGLVIATVGLIVVA